MKVIRKIVSCILLISFIFTCSAMPAAASSVETPNSEDTFTLTELENIVSEKVNSYADVIQEYCDSDSIAVSQPFPVYRTDDETAFMVFIFSGDSCIGFLTLRYEEGQFYSSITFEELEEIGTYFAQETSFYVSLEQLENGAYETLEYRTSDSNHQGTALQLRTITLCSVQPLADYSNINVT